MFGDDVLGTLLFATVPTDGELTNDPVWVEQCKTLDVWEVLDAEDSRIVRCA